MTLLQDFLTTGVFAFIIIFVRFGTAMMMMPGIGDSFVPMNVRLLMALGICLVMTPVIQPFMPHPLPDFANMIVLIFSEFLVGLFIGTVIRILMTSLDTAGMLISMSSGISNAQIFNPSLATQGSVFGAFLSVLGMTLVFVTNMHHLMIHGFVESYHMFPLGQVPDTGDMAELISKTVASAFMVGFQMAMPFVIISLVLYIAMGVLSRLMPQLQVIMLAVPGQILLALITFGMAISALMLYWLSSLDNGLVYFLSQSSGNKS